MRTAARTLDASHAWTCAHVPVGHRRDRTRPGCCRGHRDHHDRRSRRRGADRSRHRHRRHRGRHRGHRHGHHRRRHHRGWGHRAGRPSSDRASSRATGVRLRGACHRRDGLRRRRGAGHFRIHCGPDRQDAVHPDGACPGRERTGCCPDGAPRHPDVPGRRRGAGSHLAPDRSVVHRGGACPGTRRTGCYRDGRCPPQGADRGERPAWVQPVSAGPMPGWPRLPAPPVRPGRPERAVPAPAPGPSAWGPVQKVWRRPAWPGRQQASACHSRASSEPRASVLPPARPEPPAPASLGTLPEGGVAPAVRWSMTRT